MPAKWHSHTFSSQTEGNDMLNATPEYVNALAQERYHRYVRTAPPRRVTGRRGLDLPARLVPRAGARDSGTRAA